MTPFRPTPGKSVKELVQNRVVTVKGYGTDASGEYVEVTLAGSYGASMRLPLSCIRSLTDNERSEESDRQTPCRTY